MAEESDSKCLRPVTLVCNFWFSERREWSSGSLTRAAVVGSLLGGERRERECAKEEGVFG